MNLTQAQAARAASVSRTTIWRAVREGRLSAERLADGSLRIDGSELLRVFPAADLTRVRVPRNKSTRTVAGDNGTGHAAETVEALRTHLEELKADKRRAAEELERAAAERAQLLSLLREKDRQLDEQLSHVRMLTDQRPKKKSWWKRLW